MINQNSREISSKDATISRQTRYAFLTAIIFSVVSLINFTLSLQVSLKTGRIVSYIDTVAVALFFISSVYVASLVRKGQKDSGIWQLIFTLIFVLGIRNLVNADMGILFSILIAVLLPMLALITLKQDQFNRVLAISLATASLYLVLDILFSRYLPDMRQSGDAVYWLQRMTGVAVAILTVSYLYILFQQARYLLLLSKLTLGMTMVVILPLVILGAISNFSLDQSLSPRQAQALDSQASYLAENINDFLVSNQNAVGSEAQSSNIRDFILGGKGMANGDIISDIRSDLALETLLSYKRKDILNIRSYAVIDMEGINILDTNAENIGNYEGSYEYFSAPLENGAPYISDVKRGDQLEQYNIVFSAPILSEEGEYIGVLRAQYDAKRLNSFFERYAAIMFDNAESNNFAALLYEIPVKSDLADGPKAVYLILANSLTPDLNHKIANRLTTSIITPLQMGGLLPPGSTAQLSLKLYGLEDALQNRSTSPTFEAQAFPRNEEKTRPTDLIATADLQVKKDWIVLISQDLITANLPIQQQRDTITFLTVIVAVISALFAYFASRYLIKPILSLTDIAESVADGDFSRRVVVNTEDEIGRLAGVFNTMTEQLDTLIKTLEERVSERTADIEHRSEQLQAAVEIGNVAVGLRNIENLLSQAAELISLRFGFYHVGIFLLDEQAEYAVLKAANSEGGKRMLARNHKLKVGEVGIVGYVTETGQARIALDVGQDAVYFDNPDLPETRSEMALALIAGGQILGALDIQSTRGEAFSKDDISTLQVLADQIAVSIENAHLFEENNEAYQALRRAYGEQSHISWKELMYTRKNYGYQGKRDGSVVPIATPTSEKTIAAVSGKKVVLDETESTANLPITVRGNTIGMLKLAKPETSHSWTESELELAQTLSVELSGALDSARLFDETRKQAEQEYILGEITDKMRESMNVESIAKVAAEEIYQLLDLENIAIHFVPEDDENEAEA